ncbi:hypothetical protein DBR06_SOUSAS4710040 [Sousa chinensis]|nr:hypothetical protein DBR06_SOUSAS4710040 [Sousa chinensis]
MCYYSNSYGDLSCVYGSCGYGCGYGWYRCGLCCPSCCGRYWFCGFH